MMPVQALTAPLAPALTGGVLCAVSLAASREQPLVALQVKLPKVSLPKVSLPKVSLPKLSMPKIGLPKIDIDLPNFGKKSPAAPKSAAATSVAAPPPGSVRVRASNLGNTTDAPNASAAAVDTIAPGAGYKRFPARRMPGANMEGWKKLAKDIGSNM